MIELWQSWRPSCRKGKVFQGGKGVKKEIISKECSVSEKVTLLRGADYLH